jgi:hypothetical protein
MTDYCLDQTLFCKAAILISSDHSQGFTTGTRTSTLAGDYSNFPLLMVGVNRKEEIKLQTQFR